MTTRTLEQRVQELEDRTAISELVARYGLVMDNRDLAAMPALFTADVRIRSGDGVMDCQGREATVELFRGRFKVLGPSNHFTHDRIVTFSPNDPDAATGIVLSHAEMNRLGQPMLNYVPTDQYLDVFRPEGLATRNRAYATPTAADWPETLATWQAFYGK